MYDRKSREKMAQEVIRELHAAEPHFYRGNDLRHAASPWCCEATLGALQTITPMRIDQLEEITSRHSAWAGIVVAVIFSCHRFLPSTGRGKYSHPPIY